jgi:hypothetical protein
MFQVMGVLCFFAGVFELNNNNIGLGLVGVALGVALYLGVVRGQKN